MGNTILGNLSFTPPRRICRTFGRLAPQRRRWCGQVPRQTRVPSSTMGSIKRPECAIRVPRKAWTGAQLPLRSSPVKIGRRTDTAWCGGRGGAAAAGDTAAAGGGRGRGVIRRRRGAAVVVEAGERSQRRQVAANAAISAVQNSKRGMVSRPRFLFVRIAVLNNPRLRVSSTAAKLVEERTVRHRSAPKRMSTSWEYCSQARFRPSRRERPGL